LPALRQLNLSRNNLTGVVPNFNSLQSLQQLFASNNNLFGELPNFEGLESLQTLFLNNNRLSGNVPDFDNLMVLQELNLVNNRLSGLPAFSNLPLLNNLLVSGNMLTFEDLIPNVNVPAQIFGYTPQDTIGVDTLISVDLGTSYRIELGFDQNVTGSVYTWFRDNSFFTTTSVPFLDVNLFTLEDRSSYYCVVSNNTLPFLLLVSRTYRFMFIGGSSNDLCVNAIDLSEDPDICNTFDFFDLTNEELVPSCGVGKNVWFKFIARGKRVNISLQNVGFEFPTISLFDFGNQPCQPAAANEIGCGLSIDFESLIEGREYYIAVNGFSDGSPTSFTLCLVNQAGSIITENDFPCDAIGIAPSVCLSGNTALANSDIANPNCLASSTNTVWYKTKLSTGNNNLVLDLSTNNFFGNVSVVVGVFADGCSGEFTPVPGGSFCQRGTIFQIPNLQVGIEYYIQIATSDIEGGAFLLCASETGRNAVCGSNNSCQQGPNGPLNLPVYSDRGTACYSGCSTDAPPGINQSDNSCYSFYAPTVWYTFDSDELADFVSLTITSTEMLRPYFAIFKTSDCNQYENIICKVEGNGQVRLQRFPIERNTRYHIAISDFYGRDGLFSLCLNTHQNTSVCNVENRIVPIATSLDSPLEGPYRPGEKVTFCYTLETWQFVNCNWLQAVIPQFGPCWDPQSFDSNGQPVEIDNFFMPFSVGEWIWLPAGEATYNINNPRFNLRAGDSMPAGWYFINQNSGVPSNQLNVNNSLGDGIRCALDNPMWQICFTLTASSELNCSETSNCNISIKTYTDGEIGGRNRAACLLDVPTFFNTYLDCCNNPVVASVPDQIICSGEEINIPLIANDSMVRFIVVTSENPNLTGVADGIVTRRIRQTIVNQSKLLQHVDYTVIPESEGCLGTPMNFRVTIYPTPISIVAVNNEICIDDMATLSFQLEGLGPFEIQYTANNIPQPVLTTSGSEITIGISPVVNTIYRITQVTGANGCMNSSTGSEATLIVRPKSLNQINQIICEGEVFEFEGQSYDSTGVYDRLLTGANQFGCDSTVRINLTVGEIFRDSVRARICFGTSFVIGNNTLSEPGNYVAVLPTQFNCDSIIFLNLRVGERLVISDTLLINDSGSGNGAIGVMPGGGFPPYRYNWSTGSNAPLINNLGPGEYRLTLTDDIDCQEVFTFTIIDLSTSTHTIDWHDFSAQIWPVPTSPGGPLWLKTNAHKAESAKIITRNITGQIINQQVIDLKQGISNFPIPTPTVPGIYFLEIHMAQGRRGVLRFLLH
jgi:hypothetical protein